MGCWGKSEKAVDAGEWERDLCSRGGRHWIVVGQWGTGLTEAKATVRNKAVTLGGQDGVTWPQNQTEGSESQVLVFSSGDPQKQPAWISQMHCMRGPQADSNTDADGYGSLVRPSSIPNCSAYQHAARLGPADVCLRIFSGVLGRLQLFSQAAVVCGM